MYFNFLEALQNFETNLVVEANFDATAVGLVEVVADDVVENADRLQDSKKLGVVVCSRIWRVHHQPDHRLLKVPASLILRTLSYPRRVCAPRVQSRFRCRYPHHPDSPYSRPENRHLDRREGDSNFLRPDLVPRCHSSLTTRSLGFAPENEKLW